MTQFLEYGGLVHTCVPSALIFKGSGFWIQKILRFVRSSERTAINVVEIFSNYLWNHESYFP